jgi:hypothetical protein
MLPAGPIVKVSPPSNLGLIGPCVVISAELIVVSAAMHSGAAVIIAARLNDFNTLLRVDDFTFKFSAA